MCWCVDEQSCSPALVPATCTARLEMLMFLKALLAPCNLPGNRHAISEGRRCTAALLLRIVDGQFLPPACILSARQLHSPLKATGKAAVLSLPWAPAVPGAAGSYGLLSVWHGLSPLHRRLLHQGKRAEPQPRHPGVCILGLCAWTARERGGGRLPPARECHCSFSCSSRCF